MSILNYCDYKLSKYNYFIEGKNSSIIYYNHLYKQLCSFPEKYKLILQECIKAVANKEQEKVNNISVFKELCNRHAVLPVDFDEDAVSHVNYMEEITKNALCFIIYPTLACNFRCPYCYQDHENSNMSESISSGIIAYVKKHIPQYRELHVAWFGGEPLLRLDFIRSMAEELIDICHKRSRLYTSAITTNGYYLDKETFLILYNLNVRKFTVTIDGLHDVHDKQRVTADGKPTLDRILSNLLSIKTVSRNLRFEMNIRSNISKEGLKTLESYVHYMSSLFSDDDRFCFSFRPVFDWGGNNIDDFRDHLLEEKLGSKSLYDLLYQFDCPVNYFQHYEEITNSSICYASHLHTYAVEPDGRLSKCTSANRDMPNYFVGEIDDKGNMKRDMNLVAQWSTPYKDRESCRNCFFEASCHSNFCVVDKVIFNSHAKKCPGGKEHISEYIMLLDKNNDYYHYIEEIEIKD